jgi:tetratricopeptide (TPR) repeat protein
LSVIILGLSGGGVLLFNARQEASGSGNPDNLDELSNWIQRGQHAEAIARMTVMLKEEDLSVENKFRLHSLMGVALHQQERYPEAVGAFMSAAEIDPNVFSLHLNLNETFRAMGLNTLSTASLRTALELAPENMLVNIKWRLRLIETGNSASVRKELEGLSPDESQTPDVLVVSAALHLAQNDLAAALELLKLAEEHMSPTLMQACLSEPIFRGIVAASASQ